MVITAWSYNDDMVNLRQVELMDDAITNQMENDGYVCSTCSHRIKDKNIFCDPLQRHVRIHTRKSQHEDKKNDLPSAKKSKENQQTVVCESAKATNATTGKCI